MTDRRARLAATRSPAFMAGYDAYSPWALIWDPLPEGEYRSGWEHAESDYERSREDAHPGRSLRKPEQTPLSRFA